MDFTNLRLRLFPELHAFPPGTARHNAWFEARIAVGRPLVFAWLVTIVAAIGAGILLSRVAVPGGLRVVVAGTLLALPIAVPVALWFLWRRAMRRSLQRQLEVHEPRTCHECGYDMRHNLSPFCAECGTVVPLRKQGRTADGGGATDDRAS